jgi:hypothetical protein
MTRKVMPPSADPRLIERPIETGAQEMHQSLDFIGE